MSMTSIQQELDRVHREEMMRKAAAIRRARDLRSANGKSRNGAMLRARVSKTLSTLRDRLQHWGRVKRNTPAHRLDGERSYDNLAKSH